MKRIVVFSGAGISEESGITTFRDSGGLWEKYDYNLVATTEGWRKNKQYVLDFYNEARQLVKKCNPNQGHYDLAKLEEKYHVDIITQNVDDLHERAGSKNIVHLHGELFKSRSSMDPTLVYDCPDDINLGDKCEKFSQIRPHIVWFGEEVPEMDRASKIVKEADILIVVGTSLQVYPAANILTIFQGEAIYLIDPAGDHSDSFINLKHIQEKASVGVDIVVKELLGAEELNTPSLLSDEEINEAAEEWVFVTNGHRWSNNDDTVGDNFGSFKAGVEWALKKLPNESSVNKWILFRESMPELNQQIEIYWSTDEITKQIWLNDIPWTGNEIPRFWRACL